MTTHRFPALGDSHLIAGPRLADRRDALAYIIADAQRGPVDAWLWPGDLTHEGMTIELRNLLVEIVTTMARVAPVVIARGNHDPEGDLDFLARLHTTWPVFVATRPVVLDVPLATAKDTALALACLPYPTTASLVAAGTPHEEIGAAAGRALDVIFMQLGAALADARAAGRLTGAIGHVNIAGSVSSVGQPQIGQELEIGEGHLARLGDCFKVFAHIHKHQRVGSAVYPGSNCRLDWGETERKGFLLVECERFDFTGPALGGSSLWSHAETFVPIPVPPMFHVEGTLSRDGFDWVVKKGPDGPQDDAPMVPCPSCASDPVTTTLFDSAPPALACAVCAGTRQVADFTGCDVRVRASYPSSEASVLDGAKARIRTLPAFVGARRFEFEPMAVSDRTVRAPEVVAAQTFDEKLRAWAKLSAVAWAGEITACAERLQQTDDGDAVVAAATARLTPLVEIAREVEVEESADIM